MSKNKILNLLDNQMEGINFIYRFSGNILVTFANEHLAELAL